MRRPEPVTLSGYGVTLRPLAVDDAEPLFAALGGDPEVWRWLPTRMPADEAELRLQVESRLRQQAAGELLPFAVVADGEVVGTTSYLDIAPDDDRIEIGWTSYARRVWATNINPAAKLLLLTSAFEQLGAERVCLKTDLRNERSQSAIARLGAVREGVLRHDRRLPDGSHRDTVYFSILRAEWPATRDALLARLSAAQRSY